MSDMIGHRPSQLVAYRMPLWLPAFAPLPDRLEYFVSAAGRSLQVKTSLSCQCPIEVLPFAS
jgi:hypothetical protein